jgi:hypothetical protein
VKVLLVDEGRDRTSVAAAGALVERGQEVGSGSATPKLSSGSLDDNPRVLIADPDGRGEVALRQALERIARAGAEADR